MKTGDAIRNRRSIRRFKDQTVEKEKIEELLELATLAPSGKNKQPWRFVVLRNDSKIDLLEAVDKVLKRLQKSEQSTGSFSNSLQVMEEAPILILVFNNSSRQGLSKEFVYANILVDTQSIGAAIQNMLLAAQTMGLGTLWICDILYASEEVCSFVSTKDELIAAVAVGYAAEAPAARLRKAWQDVCEFMD